MIAKTVLDLIANTPLVKINKMVTPDMATIYGKLESFSPGFSVKDRICLSMINDAEQKGILNKETVVVEPTSGNTGIGLALVCAVKGYRLILTMPETMSVERRHLLKRFGAELVLTPGAEGMKGAIKKAEEIASQNQNSFMPQQFNNPANPKIHRETTAEEIWEALDGKIDAFVAGVGTGGTVTGCGEVFKKRNPNIRICTVEPKTSPVISGGAPGKHRIQGLGAGFIPQNLNRAILDEVIQIDDMAAWEASLQLAAKEGILCGVSTGANFLGAYQLAKKLGPGKNVVFIVCDTGERYLSMDEVFKA
ncbi:MAG: cysteine synthase A [Candidatus Omnitrophica bacterium]|nr:cysteine synthase A [Candidatus Omnitrophota bacterium]